MKKKTFYKKHNNPLFVVFALLALMIMAVFFYGIFFFVQHSKTASENNTVHPQKRDALGHVAYYKDGDIWVVDSNGSEKKKLVNGDGKLSGIISWKSPSELSYVSCTVFCRIETRNIYAEKTVFETPLFERIPAFAWDTNGKFLAYIVEQNSKWKFMVNRVEGNGLTISLSEVRAGGEMLDDDEMSVSISPNGGKTAVVVTAVQTKPKEDFQTIWVFDTNGDDQFLVKSSQEKIANQAQFLDEETFVYKKGEVLFQYDFVAREQEAIAEIDGFTDLSFVTHLQFAYASSHRSWPEVGVFDLSTKIASFSKSGFISPKWIENGKITAIQVKEGREVAQKTSPSGLALIDVANGNVQLLDTGNISSFAISP